VRRVALPLSLLLLAAVPATAAADIRFRGGSRQGQLATLRTGDDGMLVRFGIYWRAPCRRPGFSFNSKTHFRPPFDSVTRTRATARSPFSIRPQVGPASTKRSRVQAHALAGRAPLTGR
jgi:hypothetical protein